MESSSDSERDQKILDITQQLCQRLDIPDYKPRKISWRGLTSSSTFRGTRRVPRPWPHDIVMVARTQLALASGMKSRLDPEEFRPLIASELIYAKKLRGQVLTVFLVTLIATLAAVVTEFIFLPRLLPAPYTTTGRNGVTTTQPLGSFISLLTGPWFVITGTLVITILYARRIRLQADNSTERVLGPGSLLNILDKIASIDTTWNQTTVRRAGRGASLPSLRKRIANLQKETGTSNP